VRSSGVSGTSGSSGATGATGAGGTSGVSGVNGATGAGGTSGTSGSNATLPSTNMVVAGCNNTSIYNCCSTATMTGSCLSLTHFALGAGGICYADFSMITASCDAKIQYAGPNNGAFIASSFSATCIGAFLGDVTAECEGNVILNDLGGASCIISGTCYSSIIGTKGANTIGGYSCFVNMTSSDYNTATSKCYSVILGLGSCNGANNTTSVYGISKNAGTFSIQHPDPSKPNRNLHHSFVESPTAGDNIYKYRVTVQGCAASLDLPSYYKFLNCNDHIHLSPINHFGKGYGIMDSAQSKIDFVTDTDGDYDVILIGTRKDQAVQNNWRGVERLKNID